MLPKRLNRRERWLLLVGAIGGFAMASFTVPLPTFTRCEIHGDMLWYRSLPVRYGYAWRWPDYYEAEKSRFPHATEFVHSGGLPPPFWSGFVERVIQRASSCRSCLKARDRWEEERFRMGSAQYGKPRSSIVPAIQPLNLPVPPQGQQ
jgi:hypothetical protein